MTTHTVIPGECLASIAERYGFTNPRVIYDDPANENLRRARPDPNVLLAGDQVVIPDRKLRTVHGGTERRYRFVVDHQPTYLRVRLRSADGKPRAGLPYRVEYRDRVIHGKTGADGSITHEVPASLPAALLVVTDHGRDERYQVALGQLDPVTTESGVRQRLGNLGLLRPIDGITADMALRFALHSFQLREGLEPTGGPDSATLGKLLEVHGS